MDLSELINDRSKLNHSTLAELSKMVEDYPFHQTARLLYVANLFAVRDKSFGDELRKASVLVPDRVALFQMFEGIHYEVERQKESETVENSIVTEGDDRTVNLIDNFLQSQIPPTEASENEIPEINDEDELGILNNDYNETVDDDLYNEKIVSILIKQGRYEQALEILNKICLNNPEKNTTFATQMRLLEVVVGHNAQDKH